MAVSSALIAGEADIRSATLPIFESASKPFPEFVEVVRGVVLSELPSPSDGQADETLIRVRDLIWQRVRGVDLTIAVANKVERLGDFGALCALRGWLLKHNAYSNVVLASHIELAVSGSVLAANARRVISVEEAKSIMDLMMPRSDAHGILAAVKKFAPGATPVLEYEKRLASGSGSLDGLAGKLAKESGEVLIVHTDKLIKSLRPAPALYGMILSSGYHSIAEDLLEYASRGGDLAADYKGIDAGIKRLAPDLIGKLDPVLGAKRDIGTYQGVVEIIQTWDPSRLLAK